MIILDNKVKFKYFLKIDFNCLYEDFLYKTFLIMNSTSKKITFSAFGRDSYYHRDWFKKHGFKFDRSSRKWSIYELPVENAKEFHAMESSFRCYSETLDTEGVELFYYQSLRPEVTKISTRKQWNYR